MTEVVNASDLPDNISEAAVPRPEPKDDLYRFVSGPWLSSHPIPDDRPVDGTFHALRDQAEKDVHELVKKAAEAAPDTRIGAAYSSFLDTEGVNGAGFAPLAWDIEQITVSTFADFATGLGQLDQTGVGGLAGFYVAKDSASDNDAAYLNQSGLSLPDEAYYREDTHRPIVEALGGYIERMYDLARANTPGLVPDEFADKTNAELATLIIEFETELARGHWSVEETRDAVKGYNPTKPADLPTGFPWHEWIAGTGLKTDMIVVGQPSYLEHVADMAGRIDLATFRLWAGWQILNQRAGFLPEPVSEECFNFYGRTLSGSAEQRARWKRALSFLDAHISDDVGQEFVAAHFPPENKARMDKLVGYLLDAYRERISALDWMTPATRDRALEKLGTFRAKIGYTDHWKDYEGLSFSPAGADLMDNLRAGSRWNHRYQIAKVGKPTDRSEWVAPAQMVNAFYNPVVNDITFPAAILRPPFFNPEADMAQNFGAIGAVIGHEIGHGFDDQGSQYDGQGNLHSWWDSADREAFEALTGRLVSQFDPLIPRGLKQRGLTQQHVNGRFTLGENIGDLGGLGIAVVAYRRYLADEGLDFTTAPVLPFLLPDGTALGPLGSESETDTGVPVERGQQFTGLQRLFLSWASVWRTAIRPQMSAQYLAIDPHSPAEFRCNVIARNVDEFAEAFDVHPGDGMWLDPKERVRIW